MGLFSSINEKLYLNQIAELKKQIEEQQMCAFSHCKKLENVNLPASLKTLGYGCISETNLKNVVVPYNINQIPSLCFDRCENLSKVILNEKLKSIGESAFASTAIKDVVIPKEVERIGSNAFGISNVVLTSTKRKWLRIAFLRKDDVDVEGYESFGEEPTIFCLAGSKIQKYAKIHGYATRPLSEFKM